MNIRDRLSVASAVAVLLAASALEPVFDAVTWMPRMLGAVLVVALAAALARRLRLPAVLQPLLTTLALVAYLVAVFAAPSLHHVVLPGADTVAALRGLFDAAGTDLAQYGPPAPPTPGLVLLAVGGVGLVAVAVDATASLLHRPAAAGLPLLALFAVPSAVLPGGLGWLPFVLGAAGWLALLHVEGRDRAGRWGTPLQLGGGDPVGLGMVGRRIGGAALGVAVLVPALIPGLDARLLSGGDGGSGAGNGSRSITTYNPITRLRGQLNLPDPVPVLTYTTDDPEPDYLRTTTLGVYDGAGWRQEVLHGNLRDNGVGSPVPTPVGRSSAARTRQVKASVTIDTLDAPWLPAPVTPRIVDVAGPWMWDPGSESVFSTRSNTGSVGTYTVRASRVLPDPALLTSGTSTVPGAIAAYATAVPATEKVKALTAQVTRGQSTAYGRASALQTFFRNPANNFRYSTDTTTGGSPDALQDFLTQRRGFCEQYASAMAAMLRLAGVPSRVAVGFTPGTRQGGGSYLVTTSNAHAWPEAWFDGAGWVRFEPTPSQGGITPPAYGSGPVGQQSPATTGPALASQDGAVDPNETPAQRADRLRGERGARAGSGAPAAATARRSGANGGPPWLPIGLGVGLLAAAAPSLLHAARRRRRWHHPGAAVAWAQLRDDATDTGHDWRPAESPRSAGARLILETGLTGAAAAAVARLTTAVERARYAPAASGGLTGTAADALLADSREVRRALRRAAAPRQRTRALLLPPSTLRWASSAAGSRTADLLDAIDALVSLVGRRLRRQPA